MSVTPEDCRGCRGCVFGFQCGNDGHPRGCAWVAHTGVQAKERAVGPLCKAGRKAWPEGYCGLPWLGLSYGLAAHRKGTEVMAHRDSRTEVAP